MPTPTIGPELLANASSPSGVQLLPTVTALANGRFVIAWHDIADSHYKARVFNADGSFSSTADSTILSTNLSSFTNTIENRIELAGLADNDFAAVFAATTNGGDVLYERFTFSTGGGPTPLKVFSQPVNANAGGEAGLEENPCVAVSAAGELWIGYVDVSANGDHDTLARGYNGSTLTSNGGGNAFAGNQVQVEGFVPQGSGLLRVFLDVPSGNICVNNPANVVGAGSHPHVAQLADGGFVVSWDGTAGDVLVRVYDYAGGLITARTGATAVDGAGAAAQSHVCALDDGRFLVVWQEVFISGQTSFDFVMGRLYQSDGTSNSDTFTIDQFAFPTGGEPVTGAPRAAELADGRVVVTYQDGRASDADIKFKILDPRIAGVNVAGTSFADDHVGSAFDDVFVEGAGNDKVDGGGGNDALYGGTGDDILIGGTGADLMNGGTGNDWYFVDNANDTIKEAVGQGALDRVFVSSSYTLTAGAEVEIMSTTDNFGTAPIGLNGNALAQSIYGNAGDNILRGGGGGDGLVGFAGNDWYLIDDLRDVVIETAGGGTADRVFASVSWNLTRNAEIEIMSTDFHAGTAAINLRGNELGNLIYGNAGTNILVGRDGIDTLYGGVAAGNGNDFFLFEVAPSSTSNFDYLPDYNPAEDEIWLLSSVFPGLPSGFLSPAAFSSAGPAPQDADDRVLYNPSNGYVYFDPDGVGGTFPELFAIITPGTVLSADEFRIV